jgi:hypothetical protein
MGLGISLIVLAYSMLKALGLIPNTSTKIDDDDEIDRLDDR